jgi:transcriptional regulator with XRE-family HTH domain
VSCGGFFRAITEDLIQGHPVQGHDPLGQIHGGPLRSTLDAGQVPGIGVQLLCGLDQCQACRDSMFSDLTHAFSIAYPAIECKRFPGSRIAGRAYLAPPPYADHGGMAKTDIGHTIDRLRIVRGWTKKELSEKSGVEAGNLNRIISGRQNPTIERLEQLASALRVHVSDIFRLAETGQSEDQRKTALVRMVEQLDSEQLDQYFRRWPDGNDEPAPSSEGSRKKAGKG